MLQGNTLLSDCSSVNLISCSINIESYQWTICNGLSIANCPLVRFNINNPISYHVLRSGHLGIVVHLLATYIYFSHYILLFNTCQVVIKTAKYCILALAFFIMVWSVAGLLRFSPQSMQNETATQTAESAIQSSNCVAMTATQFLKQKLVPAYAHTASCVALSVNACGLLPQALCIHM